MRRTVCGPLKKPLAHSACEKSKKGSILQIRRTLYYSTRVISSTRRPAVTSQRRVQCDFQTSHPLVEEQEKSLSSSFFFPFFFFFFFDPQTPVSGPRSYSINFFFCTPWSPQAWSASFLFSISMILYICRAIKLKDPAGPKIRKFFLQTWNSQNESESSTQVSTLNRSSSRLLFSVKL